MTKVKLQSIPGLVGSKRKIIFNKCTKDKTKSCTQQKLLLETLSKLTCHCSWLHKIILMMKSDHQASDHQSMISNKPGQLFEKVRRGMESQKPMQVMHHHQKLYLNIIVILLRVKATCISKINNMILQSHCSLSSRAGTYRWMVTISTNSSLSARVRRFKLKTDKSKNSKLSLVISSKLQKLNGHSVRLEQGRVGSQSSLLQRLNNSKYDNHISTSLT